MSKKVNLNDLSAAERKALLKELAAEEKKAKQAKQGLYDEYKKNVSKTVDGLFPKLLKLSAAITDAKQMVYDKTQELLQQKASLYESSVNNQSHTFTNEDGTISITIGFRVVDGWDDTVTAGIEKVKKYIGKITAGEDDSKKVQFLKETVDKLLSKDAQGNLKASRVLELKKVAEKIEDKQLQEGISIIESSFKPKRTKNFVSVMYADADGKQCALPLSMTDADVSIQN
jgi:hypothetical protein